MDLDFFIRRVAEQCKTAFTECLAHEVLDQVGIRSAQGNFNLWCAELKVTSIDDKSTLDYRLRNKENIRNIIRDLLRGLLCALSKCRQLIDVISETDCEERKEQNKMIFEDESEGHDNESNNKYTEEQHRFDDGQQSPMSWEAISDESEFGGSNPSPDNDESENPVLAEQIMYMRTILDQLMQSSLTIRQSGNKYRFKEADAELNEAAFDDFRKHLTAIILMAYPDPDAKCLTAAMKAERVADHNRLNTIQARLVHNNLLRRNRIQWATKSRFSKPDPVVNVLQNELASPKQGYESIISSGSTFSKQMRTHKAPPSNAVRPTSRTPLPIASGTTQPFLSSKTATDVDSRLTVKDIFSKKPSSTATHMTKIGGRQTYPRNPTPSVDGSLHCPYCDKVLPAKFSRPEYQSSWSAHVVYDIVPYSCIIEDCDTPEEMYLTSEALLTHVVARHSVERWTCDYCTSGSYNAGHPVVGNTQIFETAEDWQTHVGLEHATIVPVENRTTFAELNKRAMIGPLECPLCPYVMHQRDTNIDDHILQHLHEFALKSLPEHANSGSEAASDVSQASGSMSHTTLDSAEDGYILAYPTFQPHEVQKLLNRQWRNFNEISDLTPIPTIYWPERLDPANVELWNVQSQVLVGVLNTLLFLQLNPLDEPKENHLELRNMALEAVEQMKLIASRPAPSIFIPLTRNKDFVNRGTILDQIYHSSNQPGSRVALVGLGGVGYVFLIPGYCFQVVAHSRSKSEVALEYAYRIHEETPWISVFWVHASNSAQFEQSFRDIANYAKIPRSEEPKANIFQLVHDWLRNKINGPWVLILDNVDDVDVLKLAETSTGVDPVAQADETRSVSLKPLVSFLPHCQHGSILLTTRSRNAALELVESHDIIEIEAMDEAGALTLLRKNLHGHVDNEYAAECVDALDYMPLAIVQAAAYISRRWPRYSIRQYLDEFRTSVRKQTSYGGQELCQDGGAKNSILTTWQISFDYIRQFRPSAADMLSLMSFCDRQGIPEMLLHYQTQMNRPAIKDVSTDGRDESYEEGFKIEEREKSDHQLSEIQSDESEIASFEEDILTLRNYSLIYMNEDGPTFEMHRLVQFATLRWLDLNGQREQWRHRFLTKLCAELPNGEYENWAKCQALFPHALSAAAQAPQEQDSLRTWATVLYRTAWYALRIGNGAEAERLSVQAMKARKKLFEAEHPDVLCATEMVASAYMLRGQWEEAAKLFMQVMEIHKTKLGADHPDTLNSMAKLASTLWNQGRWSEAETLFMQVMEIRKMKLGADHPDTLSSIANLASTYRNQGRWSEAETLFMQVMKIRNTKLGADHPDTLSSIASLASTYRNQGRWSEAETLFMQVIETRNTKLGADHPATLSSMANLASTLWSQGRWSEAEKLEVQVMETRKKKLGADHPDTLSSIANLASTLWNQGRWLEAEELFVQVMETSQIKLGADHPDTLSSIANLASTYRNQGRWSEAEKLEVQVMETRKKKLGADHPDTLSSIANLASTLWNQGRWSEAEKLFVQVTETSQKKLGADHPDTLTSMANVASMYRNQGRLQAAEELQVHVLETRKVKLGPNHPDTLTSMANLAYTYWAQDQLAEAVNLMRRYIRRQETRLGVDHPAYADTAATLAQWESEFGITETDHVGLDDLAGNGERDTYVRPTSREDFSIAIICALPNEADAVTLLFDEFWDENGNTFGRARGDTNTYVTGRIGPSNVVLAVLPAPGTTNAAATAAHLCFSYSNLKLTLLVGVCGGVPKIGNDDAFLGDVVISKTIVQYDYGRQYPGRFALKKTIDCSLGRANKDIQNMLKNIETELGRQRLRAKATIHLSNLQETAIRKRRRANYNYPGSAEDRLFSPNYRHLHRDSCDICCNGSVCELASEAFCEETGCSEANLVLRERGALGDNYCPAIFIGCLGSGNIIIKTAEDRDYITKKHGIVAFEAEGAEIWDEVPCVIIKGISDYSDGHKSKRWHDFAAATAVSAARALLERYVLADDDRTSYGSRRDADVQLPELHHKSAKAPPQKRNELDTLVFGNQNSGFQAGVMNGPVSGLTFGRT